MVTKVINGDKKRAQNYFNNVMLESSYRAYMLQKNERK